MSGTALALVHARSRSLSRALLKHGEDASLAVPLNVVATVYPREESLPRLKQPIRFVYAAPFICTLTLDQEIVPLIVFRCRLIDETEVVVDCAG